ncbi:MAG: DUF4333 domain-containing protein [Actinobacteria bacterium]|nr:DUF4333 domain-containing protein [Actinomycetota bacterium]
MTCPVCSMVNPLGTRTCMRCGSVLPETPGGQATVEQRPEPGIPDAAAPSQPAATEQASWPPPGNAPVPDQQAAPPAFDPGAQPTQAFGQPGYGGYQPGAQWPQPTPPQPFGQPSYSGYQYGQQPQPPAFDPGAQPTQAFGQPGYGYGYGAPNPYPQQQPAGYGAQPGWQGAAPRRRKPTALIIVAVVAVVLVGGGLLAAKFVLGKKVFDATALNQDLAQQYKDRFTQVIQVDCPADEQVKVGRTFECSIKDSTKTITIEVKDDTGAYLWRVTGG